MVNQNAGRAVPIRPDRRRPVEQRFKIDRLRLRVGFDRKAADLAAAGERHFGKIIRAVFLLRNFGKLRERLAFRRAALGRFAFFGKLRQRCVGFLPQRERRKRFSLDPKRLFGFGPLRSGGVPRRPGAPQAVKRRVGGKLGRRIEPPGDHVRRAVEETSEEHQPRKHPRRFSEDSPASQCRPPPFPAL